MYMLKLDVDSLRAKHMANLIAGNGLSLVRIPGVVEHDGSRSSSFMCFRLEGGDRTMEELPGMMFNVTMLNSAGDIPLEKVDCSEASKSLVQAVLEFAGAGRTAISKDELEETLRAAGLAGIRTVERVLRVDNSQTLFSTLRLASAETTASHPAHGWKARFVHEACRDRYTAYMHNPDNIVVAKRDIATKSELDEFVKNLNDNSEASAEHYGLRSTAVARLQAILGEDHIRNVSDFRYDIPNEPRPSSGIVFTAAGAKQKHGLVVSFKYGDVKANAAKTTFHNNIDLMPKRLHIQADGLLQQFHIMDFNPHPDNGMGPEQLLEVLSVYRACVVFKNRLKSL